MRLEADLDRRRIERDQVRGDPEERDRPRAEALDLGHECPTAGTQLVSSQLRRRCRRARHEVDDADPMVEQLALLRWLQDPVGQARQRDRTPEAVGGAREVVAGEA